MFRSLSALFRRIFGKRRILAERDLNKQGRAMAVAILDKFGTVKTTDPSDIVVSQSADDLVSSNAGRNMGLKLFIGIVLVPVFVYSAYILLFASSQFISETRFVVRSISSNQDQNEPENVTIAVSQLTQDAHIVANYIKSPELVSKLQDRLDIRSFFSSDKIDYFSRLPKNASWETLNDYWSDQVTTYVDGPSGIIVLRIRAFSPEQALRLSDVVLDEARLLVNSLSVRAKQDLALRAEAEVRRKIEAYQQSLQNLRNYQNEVGILDPIANATAIETSISELLGRKLDAESRLYVLENTGVSDSATARQLRQLITSIESQITELEARLTGQESTSNQISAVLVPFTKLETEKLLNEELYSAARKGLDVARATELRRTINLSVFSGPTLPDDATYPRRLANIFIVSFIFFMLWSMILLSWASIEDHRE